MTEIVSQIQVYEHGYGFLTDPSGQSLYHQDFTNVNAPSRIDDSLSKIAKAQQTQSSGSQLLAYRWQGEKQASGLPQSVQRHAVSDHRACRGY